MKRSLFSALASGLLSLCCSSQITPLPSGARITVDSITTEVIVCSPERVEVIKYIDSFDGVRHYDPQRQLHHVNADGKYKIDTGNYYVALNEKDGNVSFWTHDGSLIMAEQHRSASLVPVSGSDRNYMVRQDFQFGRSGAQSITTPGDDRNMMGNCAEFGSSLPGSCVLTDKGYAVCWQSGLPARMDDTPGRKVKKPGDVTFISDAAPAIIYTFIYPADEELLKSYEP